MERFTGFIPALSTSLLVVLLLFQVYTYKQNALTRQKVQPMHHSSIAGVEDMATLEDLHEGAIMHNLFLRYQQRHIYVSFPAAVLHRETESPTRSDPNIETVLKMLLSS